MDIKILIVDDEEMIRKLIRKYALNEGYTVLEACNGQEAVDIALKEDIRVIVMDVMMPVMDGFKAYQRILAEKNIPCIFLTALNEEYNRIDLIFGDKSSDDIWIKEIDDENCYIVAYGGCDSRCMGGWIFDYRDKYKEE